MASTELVVTAVITFVCTIVLPKLFNGVVGYFTGRQKREREGWEAATEARRSQRQWETWAHRVRLVAIRHGFEHLLPRTPDGIDPQSYDSASSVIQPPRPKEQ